MVHLTAKELATFYMIGDNTLIEDTLNTTQNIQGDDEGWVTIYIVQ